MFSLYANETLDKKLYFSIKREIIPILSCMRVDFFRSNKRAKFGWTFTQQFSRMMNNNNNISKASFVIFFWGLPALGVDSYITRFHRSQPASTFWLCIGTLLMYNVLFTRAHLHHLLRRRRRRLLLLSCVCYYSPYKCPISSPFLFGKFFRPAQLMDCCGVCVFFRKKRRTEQGQNVGHQIKRSKYHFIFFSSKANSFLLCKLAHFAEQPNIYYIRNKCRIHSFSWVKL